MVKTSPSNAEDAGSIPGPGAKIPHSLKLKNQTIKQKQYCNKFSKDLFEKKKKGMYGYRKKKKKKSQKLLKSIKKKMEITPNSFSPEIATINILVCVLPSSSLCL